MLLPALSPLRAPSKMRGTASDTVTVKKSPASIFVMLLDGATENVCGPGAIEITTVTGTRALCEFTSFVRLRRRYNVAVHQQIDANFSSTSTPA